MPKKKRLMLLTNILKSLFVQTLRQFQKGVDVPILCYHQIGQEETSKFPSLYLRAHDFERQMRWFFKRGYETISLDRLVHLIKEGEKPSGKYFTITFDDGYEGVYRSAFPILQKYGFGATVFAIADRVAGKEGFTSFPFMTTAEIREVMRHGFEIGCHSLQHLNLVSLLTEKELDAEIKDSKKKMEDLLGRKVEHFCYPEGSFNERVINKVIEAGYQSASSILLGSWHTADRLFSLRRIPIGFDLRGLKFFYRLRILSAISSQN